MKFVLIGEVITKIVCISKWSVSSNTSFSLSAATASALSFSISAQSDTKINLVIYNNMLPASSSLIFTLSCGLSSASIHVTTNGPPLMGSFKALPNNGIELSTTFNFTASNYVDPDLPLTYQFGFISNNIHNVLQSRSLISITHSTLASGSVNIYVQVFDSFGIYSESRAIVIVYKQVNQQLLQESLLNALHASTGNTEATQNALVLASAILNQVSCDKAPSCDIFNRIGCSVVANTCGVCKAGFIGDVGNSNSLCVNVHVKSNSSRTTDKSTCLSDRDCPFFQSCDTITKICVLPSKTCPSDCSFQGSCILLNINTNLIVKDCKITDASCQGRCNCYSNFTGADCSISQQVLLHRQALRTEMLTGLSSVMSTSKLSTANLGSVSNTLLSLTSNVYEVSPKMAETITQVALSVLSSATKSNISVNYESLSGILTSVNTIMQVSSISSKSTQMLSMFSDLISSQLVAGEDSVDYIFDSFRMKVVSTSVTQGGNTVISAPQTPMEVNFGINGASSITIQQSSDSSKQADMSISMIVMTASSYGTLASKMNNNPVQLKLSTKSLHGNEVIFTLVHNSEIDFTNTSYAAYMGFNSTCHGTLDHSIYNYTCPVSHEILQHKCNGRTGVLRSYCKILVPQCALLNSESGDLDTASSICSVLEYTKIITKCKCIIQSRISHRRLNNAAVDGVVNVVSTSLYIANNFKDTFSSAGDLNSVAALQRVLIIIVMFSTMWAAGLLLIFGCIWRKKYMKKVNIFDQKMTEKQRRVALISHSVAVVQQNLLNYTSQVFPSIFSNEPIARRIWLEISRHHRYLTLLTASKGDSGDNQRILTCIQLLSVQTMLMFLLALLYDLQGPSDDGT